MTRLALLLALLLILVGSVAGVARADGLPVEGVDAGPGGVATLAGDVRYVTLPAGRDTVLARVEANGGRVLASRLVGGRFTIPAVAYDGSAAGLSGDGRTLLLIRPRAAFPRARTTFAVVDTRRLRVREVITLRGDFSFDALSPSGSWLYLVQYLSPDDPTRYLVRLYDLEAGRLLREPIIDPRVVGDVMRGLPITRVASADGRLAYTLYDGAGAEPFVHALDTEGRTAHCIDLPLLAGRGDLLDLRLRLSGDGGTLAVVAGDEVVALADTRSYSVREPAEPAEPAPAADVRPSDSVPRELVAAGGLLLLLGAAGVARLLARKRRAEVGGGGGSLEPLEVLAGVGDEVQVELGDPLLDDAPHRLPEVRREAHDPERAPVGLP